MNKGEHSKPNVLGLILAAALMTVSAYSAADTTIYIDPETGQFVDAPPEGAEDLSQHSRSGRAAREPEPEQALSPVPGGGVMVRRPTRER